MPVSTLLLAAACAGVLGGSPAGVMLAPTAVLRGVNVGAGTQFGYAVSVSQGGALIGQPLVPTGLPGTHGDATATAYIYRNQLREAELPDSVPTNPPCEVCAERYGSAVAIRGDLAVVGTPRRRTVGDDSGAVFVFTRNVGANWVLAQVLLGSDSAAGDLFGSAVATDGATILVGAPGDEQGAGGAYAFTRVSGFWTQLQKLTGKGNGAGAAFGSAVAVDGGLAAVGAPMAGASAGGRVHAFEFHGGSWVESQTIESPRAGGGNLFGASVSLDAAAGALAAGAPGESMSGAPNVGAAYVFARLIGAWSQQQRFEGTSFSPIRYGMSVATRGGVLVIGAPPKPPSIAPGIAYIFTRLGATWTQSAFVSATDGNAGEEYGRSVSIDGDLIAVGAPNFEFDGLPLGAAFLYTITITPCVYDLTFDAVVDSRDLAVLLSRWGTADPEADFSHNGEVDSVDLGLLLGGWGPCQ